MKREGLWFDSISLFCQQGSVFHRLQSQTSLFLFKVTLKLRFIFICGEKCDYGPHLYYEILKMTKNPSDLLVKVTFLHISSCA